MSDARKNFFRRLPDVTPDSKEVLTEKEKLIKLIRGQYDILYKLVRDGDDRLTDEVLKLVLYCENNGVILGKIGQHIRTDDNLARFLYRFLDGGNSNAVVVIPFLLGKGTVSNQDSIESMEISHLIISEGIAETLLVGNQDSDALAIQIEIDKVKGYLGL